MMQGVQFCTYSMCIVLTW